MKELYEEDSVKGGSSSSLEPYLAKGGFVVIE